MAVFHLHPRESWVTQRVHGLGAKSRADAAHYPVPLYSTSIPSEDIISLLYSPIKN